MIKSVHIQNFKSINDLTLDLGSFNVLIGENGCGKSNILEGLAFGAAASADKLDKQAIVTTHNPAILDGLDLEDDAHRLFVVRRNEKGHTVANRIEYNDKRKKKLSEIWGRMDLLVDYQKTS